MIKEDLEKVLFQDKKIDEIQLPTDLNNAISAIKQKNPQIHEDIVLLMLLTELSLVVGSLRKPIALDPFTNVTVSTIAFCLANSGYGKDSTKSLISNVFDKAYEIIDTKREELLNIKAVQDAVNDGYTEEDAFLPEIRNKYKAPLEPLKAAISTNEGIITHANLLEEISLGSLYIYTGEFADMLSTSALLTDNITLLSELYDLGNKERKVIKDKTRQSKEIKEMPISTLFVGSLDLILNTDKLKETLKLAFSSKLARRSIVFYSTKKHLVDQSISLDEYLSQNTTDLENVYETLENLGEVIKTNTQYFLTSVEEKSTFTLSDDALKIYNIYKLYCTLAGENVSNENVIYKLTITNQYWKALKLAPIFTFLRKSSTITEEDMVKAISIIENYSKYSQQLEEELNKEMHEALCSYALNNLNFVKNTAKISPHTLTKGGFIKSGNPQTIEKQVRELVILANSSGNDVLFEMNADNSITAFKLEKTEKVGVSYIKCEGTKEERAKKCREGYIYKTCDFEKLVGMLSLDTAYSPFEFKNGVRLKENVVPTTNMLVLDVDDTNIAFKDMHEILKDIKHIIVQTSNPENIYKYRILLELDTKITFSSNLYKKTLKAIGEKFSATVDTVPISQIFFGYSNREILHNFDGIKLDIKDIISKIQEETPLQKPKQLSHALKQEYMQDKERKFLFAMNPPMGQGMISLYKAYRLAKDVGFNKQECVDLIYWLNDQWDHPMDIARLNGSLIRQIENDSTFVE